MKYVRRTALTLSAALLLSGSVALAEGNNNVSQWPSEREQQLAQLDSQLVTVQQQLYTAKQTNDTDGINSYTAQFNTIQEQRLALLRAMGLVNDNSDD